MKYALRHARLHILDCERIVGTSSSKLVASVIPVERVDINTVLRMYLVVRVSGYSALFCDLGKQLQDEIIKRTEFGN